MKKPIKKSVKKVVVSNTLEQRGSRYGKFSDHAAITQALKQIMRGEELNELHYQEVQDILEDKWKALPPNMKEALEMIAHKIGRILNGDHTYDDSWHDIQGYANLVEKKLHGEDI